MNLLVVAVCEDMSQPLVVTQSANHIALANPHLFYLQVLYPCTTHACVLSHASRSCVIPLFELCTLYLARGIVAAAYAATCKQQSTARHSLNASNLIVCTAVRLVGDLMTTECHLLGMILDLSNIATVLRHPSLEWMAHQPAHILLF